MTPELDPFQHDALAFFDAAKGRAVLADPMGARKTGTALSWLAQQPEGHRALIVAPGPVHGHWAREAAIYHPNAWVSRSGGTAARRRQLIEDAATASSRPGHDQAWLHLTTYESMKADQRWLLDAGFHGVVFDEGHHLKGRTTQVAFSANKLTARRPWLLLLTGTPVLNHPAELWQYLHMLAPKVYKSYWAWVEEHFIVEMRYFTGNRFPTKIIHDYRPGHGEIVRQEIAPFFLQRELHELFPGQAWIEEAEHVEVSVELSPAERKAYDSLVKFQWTKIDGVEVATKNSLDLSTRLQQLTSDWGGLAEGAKDGTKVDTTVKLVLDLLERDDPIVVAARFNNTVDRIVARLSDKVRVRKYTSDVDAQAFAAGELDVLVGTLDLMGEGVDGLQHVSATMVMVDRFWTSVKNDQMVGRLRRSGQTKRVTVYHVYAEGTIDDTIARACLRKTNVIRFIRGLPLVDVIYGRVT